MRRQHLSEINTIIIHCSGTPNGNDKYGAREIDDWHRARGWDQIGYHLVIRPSGVIEPGRSISYAGAHTVGKNQGSLAPCMIGTDKYTVAQWEALSYWVRKEKFYLPSIEVYGHNKFNENKTCPGFDVHEWYHAKCASPVGLEGHII